MQQQPVIYQRARALAFASSVIVVSGGMITLLGWYVGNPILKSGGTGLVAMNPATAVLFVLAAVALGVASTRPERLARRIVTSGLASVVAISGMVLLANYLAPWDLALDRVLFRDQLGNNRMAPNTAFQFVLLGFSLLTIDVRSARLRWLSQVAALLVASVSAISLVGYGYGTRQFYGIGSYIPMALNTAALFAAAAVGLLSVRPERSVFGILNLEDTGGVMCRRLLPAAIITPVILGFLRVMGQRAGLYDTEFGAALMVVSTVVLLIAAILTTAAFLSRIDAQRKAAEEQIRQFNQQLEQRVEQRTAELAEANRDLIQKNQENEMFVYSVSHDLRSPLVSLQGFSKELGMVGKELRTLLDSDAVPEEIRARAMTLVSSDMQQSLNFIETGVLRLSNIIDALLRLSRVGRVEYQSRPVDVNKIVTRVVESMSVEMFDRDVEIQVRELPPCYGDATAIEQLFANLIGNAIKYLDRNRKGLVEVEALASERAGTGTQTYYVRDNGLGIAPAYHEKIFQAFQRVHPKHAPGEGMGLAIVRRIVERHGGRVWVESSNGSGSTFFITLPTRALASGPAVETQRPQSKGESHGYRTDGHFVGGRR